MTGPSEILDVCWPQHRLLWIVKMSKNGTMVSGDSIQQFFLGTVILHNICEYISYCKLHKIMQIRLFLRKVMFYNAACMISFSQRVTLWWTSVISRGSRNTLSHFMLRKRSGLVGHLARMRTLPSFTYQTENGEHKDSQSIPNQGRGEYKRQAVNERQHTQTKQNLQENKWYI